MRFCQSCNNLLYPRENRQVKSLEYYCKQNNCQYIEKNVSNSCVFVNELVKDSTYEWMTDLALLCVSKFTLYMFQDSIGSHFIRCEQGDASPVFYSIFKTGLLYFWPNHRILLYKEQPTLFARIAHLMKQYFSRSTAVTFSLIVLYLTVYFVGGANIKKYSA